MINAFKHAVTSRSITKQMAIINKMFHVDDAPEDQKCVIKHRVSEQNPSKTYRYDTILIVVLSVCLSMY